MYVISVLFYTLFCRHNQPCLIPKKILSSWYASLIYFTTYPSLSWSIKEQCCSRDPTLHLLWTYSKLILKLCLTYPIFFLNNWPTCHHSYCTMFMVYIFTNHVSICRKLNTGSSVCVLVCITNKFPLFLTDTCVEFNLVCNKRCYYYYTVYCITVTKPVHFFKDKEHPLNWIFLEFFLVEFNWGKRTKSRILQQISSE
jgi:hypothetical protein